MAFGIFPILNVADLDRSLSFYKGLGLKAKSESMTVGEMAMRWLVVESGPQHAIMIFRRDFEGADPEDVKWASGEVGKGVLLNLGVPNATKTHAAAQASGAQPDELTPNPWGGHSFNVADPDGYYLSFTDKFPDMGGATRKPAKKARGAGKARKSPSGGRKSGKASAAKKAGAKKGAASKGKKGAKAKRR